MTNYEEQLSDKTTNPKKNTGRRRRLWGLTFLFVFFAIIYIILRFFVWQENEKTDNAYVQGNLVQITAKVSAPVKSIQVEETQYVNKGDLLLNLDSESLQLIYEQAKNTLTQAVENVIQQKAHLNQSRAIVNIKKALLKNAQETYQRRLKLASSHAISKEELELAISHVNTAKADLQSAIASQQIAQAILGKHLSLSQQPSIMIAANQVRQSWLNLQRTHIYAPISGQVAKRHIEIGQSITVGKPLMVIVPLQELWVEANFKETQLKQLHIGQKVTMTADNYGEKVLYHGNILGISAGTGSAFSLLPAQNATGNWIKVVQRVPIRISLDNQELEEHPLRVGLSMSVVVNTSEDQGKPLKDQFTNSQQHIDDTDFSEVNREIDSIISQAG